MDQKDSRSVAKYFLRCDASYNVFQHWGRLGYQLDWIDGGLFVNFQNRMTPSPEMIVVNPGKDKQACILHIERQKKHKTSLLICSEFQLYFQQLKLICFAAPPSLCPWLYPLLCLPF